MFTILKWFLNIILAIIAMYFFILAYSYFKNNFSFDGVKNTINSTGSVNNFKNTNSTNTINSASNNFVFFMKDFFQPHFVSPLTVVSGENTLQGFQMPQLPAYTFNAEQSYQNYMRNINQNTNYLPNQNNYPNNNSFYNASTSYNFLKQTLPMLFPSSWMN